MRNIIKHTLRNVISYLDAECKIHGFTRFRVTQRFSGTALSRETGHKLSWIYFITSLPFPL
jgi:hypothetical protein